MTTPRAVPGVSVTYPQPVVMNGIPVLPVIWGKSDSTATVREGPKHLHSIPNPDPWHAPDLPQPPPDSAPGFKAIWRVHDLPDPSGFNDGWYWLGDRTGTDGTSGLPDNCTHWPASEGSSGSAPAWHSRYPFKPSVVSAEHWLYGGGTVDHPKAVNFNSQFIEHMWLDWGQERHQPFTWIVVAMLPTYPRWDYTHHILDAGRDPFDVGLNSGYGAGDCYSARDLNDGLGYRTLLTAERDQLRISTSEGRGVLSPHGPAPKPRMYCAVYDGNSSSVGVFTTDTSYYRRGHVANTSAQKHRFTVLGRRQDRLSQDAASHLLVFELRFYAKALTPDDLSGIFDHVSSVYRLGQYK